ncbi:hypothetical protein E5E91_06220 [Deinococcus radiodurans R1 = ATCC 13939 = DSM 20539]|nr:hypothetical protein DXG80_02135 [Deinococcus radiodurans]UDL00326.1 hypothetical protein E5E91_06220 [Deinococcus radiodurans R1 = ATCC 13939 = DSM 20539]HCE65541.1 hypothetical protein [Deinococcus radiodurans]
MAAFCVRSSGPRRKTWKCSRALASYVLPSIPWNPEKRWILVHFSQHVFFATRSALLCSFTSRVSSLSLSDLAAIRLSPRAAAFCRGRFRRGCRGESRRTGR